MGRFKPVPAPLSQAPGMQQQSQYSPNNNWPSFFPKPIIGLERDGVIIERVAGPITEPNQVRIIQSSLDAIKAIRLKGYKVLIITQQSDINKGHLSPAQVDYVHNHLMQVFGQAGIMSIDGLYYSTSNLKEDYYAKPNVGMFERAKQETNVNWKEGWYVGDRYYDIKAALKIGAKPVLVKTGDGAKTEQELDAFSRKDAKKQTLVFNNLLEFANTLP
jgi:D-glycero-D-manno-heptose 1,7-bisphosphate phosphatase